MSENEVTEEVTEEQIEMPLPEGTPEYADTNLYQSDGDYKRAIDHNWKPLEMFLEEGGKEKDWTGYAQFNRRFDDFQENKEIKDRLRSMEGSFEAFTKTYEEEIQREREKAIAETKARFDLAVEEGETEAAVALSKELDQMESKVEPQPQEFQEPPVVAAFRASNPMIDQNSPSYNRAFNAVVEDYANSAFSDAIARKGAPLDNDEMLTILKSAMGEAEKFLPNKQPPKAPQVSKPSADKPSRNPVKNLSRHGQEVYNMLLRTRGEEAANNYAQRMEA